MLAKKYRLTKDRDIQKVYKGKSARGSFFIMKAIENKFGFPRVAIIVGKKVSLKSTRRNLVKRRASEALKKIILDLGNADLIITALPESLDAKYNEIEKDIISVIKKLSIGVMR